MDARYRDRNLPVEERVEDLLSRMTLEEKVAQLKARWFEPAKMFACVFGELTEEKAGKLRSALASDYYTTREMYSFTVNSYWMRFWKEVAVEGETAVGHLSFPFRDLSAREGAELHNAMQKYVAENTRLGIPLIVHDECLHGCMAKGSTSFPQPIAMAATWDAGLIREAAEAIGAETAARGIHQALSPTINIARDQRCGRIQETFGEDTYLSVKMTVAFVGGLQARNVIATPKHLVANFVGDGGRDSNDVHISERLLREIYFPAFEAAIREGGALSLMSSYNSLDGVPTSCNRWLLTDILREEWGFRGFVVSDYSAVDHLQSKHAVAATEAEAARLALEAGMDLELPYSRCFETVFDLVRSGEMAEETVDGAVRRLLRCKFLLGLFDDPAVDPDRAEEICDCPQHRELALRVARRSITLLKNEGDVLPLKKDLRTVAVIGPNAAEARLGGYVGFGMRVVSPLEGIREKLEPGGTEVLYAEGCGVRDGSREGFAAALAAAERSDAVILFMGSRMGVEGEGQDRHSLDLLGAQEDLILEISRTGKPVVVVLIAGRATTVERWIEAVPSLVCAWYPGEEGGHAIADVLFGDTNPGGKLPVTFPVSSGQLPLYYNPKPTGRKFRYIDISLGEPQVRYPFGHGMSYTEFAYGGLEITVRSAGPEVVIGFDLENVGRRVGDEVAQLYLRDEVASVARPIKELKAFARFTLEPGEKRKVTFVLTAEELSLLDIGLNQVVEPGSFRVMIGSSSEDIRLTGRFEVE